MIYCVLFEDDDRHAQMRQKHMEAHLDYLKQHADNAMPQGPLSDIGTKRPAGGCGWSRPRSAGAVRQMVEADPLWPNGLRKSVRILEWKQVFQLMS